METNTPRCCKYTRDPKSDKNRQKTNAKRQWPSSVETGKTAYLMKTKAENKVIHFWQWTPLLILEDF